MADLPEYEFHRFARIFPFVPEGSDEFNILANDVVINGMLHPAILYQGKILDGITRYRICKLNPEVEFITREFDKGDKEALALVLSLNLHRRHLTESGRAMAACRWMLATGREDTKKDKGAAADIFNTSVRMIEYCKSIVIRDSKALVNAVENGHCKVAMAKKLLTFTDPEIEEALNSKEFAKKLLKKEEEAEQDREFSNGLHKENRGDFSGGTDHVYGVIYTDYDTGVDLPAASNCVVFMWASADDLYLAVDRLIDAEFIDGKIYNFIRLTNGKMTSANVEHLICATKGTVPSLPVFQQNMVLNMKTGRPIQYAEVIGEHYTVPILAMFTNQIKHKGDHWEYEPPLTIVEKPVKRNGNGKKAKTTTETETTEETTTTETA